MRGSRASPRAGLCQGLRTSWGRDLGASLQGRPSEGEAQPLERGGHRVPAGCPHLHRHCEGEATPIPSTA